MTATARQTAKVIPLRQRPDADAAYRATVIIHFPNTDELTLSIRADLMALRDRASAALNRCCPDAEPTLAEAVRLASLSCLSGAETRSLAFMRVAVDTLILSAQMIQRGQPA